MEVEVNGVVYEARDDIERDRCTGCVAEDAEYLCYLISDKTPCYRQGGLFEGVIWIKKEPIKPKEKESTMQKKEIDKSKKYKTVRGIPVELVYDNYRDGMEYLWVSFPEDEDKFVFSTNKYGENSMSGVYNLVEFNPLEELSKLPVDTLVEITQKSTGESYFRYLHSVSSAMSYAFLFDEGATSRTTTNKSVYQSKFWNFEIIK